MALHWRPVGPLPDAVYWRRRAAVLTGLLLLLLGLRACSTGSEELAGPPAPVPGASSSPSPIGPSAVPACTDEALTVSTEVAPSPLPAGAAATVRLSVVNTGASACSRAVSPPDVELLVLSGRDRIWSSGDCPGSPSASAPAAPAATTPAPAGGSTSVLTPGEPSVVEVAWNGRRSRPGCPGEGEQALPGTYRVLARVGTAQVEGTSFRVE